MVLLADYRLSVPRNIAEKFTKDRSRWDWTEECSKLSNCMIH